MRKYVLMRFPGFINKAVTLSYDDGSIHDKKLIEIMSNYGLKGTFNLDSGFLNFDIDEMKRLYIESGNEVAVHGQKHLSLTEVDNGMAVNDIINDRIALEKMFGKVIYGMAYANGAVDDRVVRIVGDCGIKYSRTTVSTEAFDITDDWLRMPTTCHHKNPRLMELAHEFIEKEDRTYYWGIKPRLFYLWGHSYEFNNDDNWNVIEEFAKYIGGRDDVWYATNTEIYDYVTAFNSLIYSADGTMAYNPTAIDVYINWNGKQSIIPAGKSVQIG